MAKNIVVRMSLRVGAEPQWSGSIVLLVSRLHFTSSGLPAFPTA